MRPPIAYPTASAASTTAMTLVHTSVVEPNRGWRTRTVVISTTMTAAPERKTVARRNAVFPRFIGRLLGRRGAAILLFVAGGVVGRRRVGGRDRRGRHDLGGHDAVELRREHPAPFGPFVGDLDHVPQV